MFGELTKDSNFQVRNVLSSSDFYLFRFLFFLVLLFGFVAGLEGLGGAINSFGTHCFV